MTFSPPFPFDGPRWAGLRVGLLGGSFNPAHEGHLHASLVARQALGLDFIWWLMTPQNPLKNAGELKPYAERMARARAVAADPRILVTDIERRFGVNRTYDTLRALRLHFPRTSFVWIMGTDNAASFHRWYRWRDILAQASVAVVTRPPALSLVGSCPLRLYAPQTAVMQGQPRSPDLTPGRTYWLPDRRLITASSTALRGTNNPFR